MFRASYAKKALAILMTLALLASCLAVAGVSAASAQDYYYQFGGTNKWNVDETSYHSSYWSQPSNAPVNKGGGASAKIVQAADNPTGSGYAMEMAYAANLDGTTNTQCYSVFSLPNTTGATRDGRSTSQTIHLLKGTLYEITVQYKVVNFVSAADLYVTIGMGNLNDGSKTLPTNNAVLTNITEATDGWVTKTAYFANTDKNGAYIVLKMQDDTNRAGTNIQIGSIKIQPIDPVSYTMDLNYGGRTPSTMQAVAGQTIANVVSDPVRLHGYTFLGWFTQADGGEQVTEFPAASTTLYAHWQAPAEPLYELTFNANGGTLIGDPTEEYLAGETITQKAVRSGYDFLGWQNAAGETVAVAPAEATALTAAWQKLGNYSPLDGLQSFETVSIGDLTFNTNKPLELSTEENHTFAGGISLKRNIVMGDNGQRSRPRLLLGDVTPGKSYTVSFWAKSAKAEPTGCTGDFKFWLGTYDKSTLADKISAEAWSPTGNVDTHTLQPLSNVSSGSLSSDNGISNVQLSNDLPTEWTRYAVTIDSVTAHKGAAENCLVLGYTDNVSAWGVGPDNWTNTLYIDDIQIAETSTLDQDVHTYEAKALGTEAVAGTENARTVTYDVMNHTFGFGGAGHTVKIDLAQQSTGCTALYNADGTILELEGGSIYELSAWVYSETPATVKVYARAAASTENEAWFGASSAQLAEKEVNLPGNQWTKVDLQAVVPMGEDYTALALGVDKGTSATEAVYLDDTSFTTSHPIQDYEKVAKEEVIGRGAALATDRNHTEGGQNSLKLTLSGTAKAERTYSVLNALGGYIAVKKSDTNGKMAYFYVYNPDDEAKTVSFAFGASPKEDPSTVPAFVINEISDSVTTITLRGKAWTPVLVGTNSGIPVSGSNTKSYVMLSVWGATGDLYIDDVKFDNYKTAAMDPMIQSFERTTVGSDLSLQQDGSTMVVLDQNHTTNGARSLQVVSTGSTIPQLNVTNGAGTGIRIEAGQKVKYMLSFWVYAPEDMTASYWVCATDGTAAFTTDEQIAAAKLYERKNAQLTAGWNNVEISFDNPVYGGLLRLGIRADDAQKILYLDDLMVRAEREKGYDPNATVQDFENFNVGDGNGNHGDLKFILKGNGAVSGNFSHASLSSQSLRLETISWGGTNRNQFLMVDPTNGQLMEFIKGGDYLVSFWVYMDGGDSYNQSGTMKLNYWICGTDDPTKALDNKGGAEYDVGGNENNITVDCGTWTRVTTTFTAKNGKYMVMGISDNSTGNAGTVFYVDDIEFSKPQQLKVRYHITGGATLGQDALQSGMTRTDLANETIIEVDAMADTQLSTLKQLTTDPYREGYQMTGWYTSPSCEESTLFDLTTDTVKGKEGDVVDLYTGWKKWEENKPSEDTEREEEIKYRDVIEWVKNWIGDDVEDPTLEAGDRPEVEGADPVSAKPKPDKNKDDGQTDGMATWLIIVIVVAAVAVVGGGAGLALVLLKKKKA